MGYLDQMVKTPSLWTDLQPGQLRCPSTSQDTGLCRSARSETGRYHIKAPAAVNEVFGANESTVDASVYVDDFNKSRSDGNASQTAGIVSSQDGTTIIATFCRQGRHRVVEVSRTRITSAEALQRRDFPEFGWLAGGDS